MSVRLNLEGDDGQITAEALHAALGDVLGLLKEAAEVADVDPPEWRVSGLEAASAHVSVAAVDERPVTEIVRDGLVALRNTAAIPDQWTRQMVKHVLNLGKRAGSGGTTEISLGLGSEGQRPHVFDTVVVDHARRALGVASSTYGSIRGTVDRWNEHGRREIGLSRASGPPVPATYSADLAARIVDEAVNNDIEAWGTIRRNVMGQITGMTLEDFRVLDETPALGISSMVGIFKRDDSSDLTLDRWLEARNADE